MVRESGSIGVELGEVSAVVDLTELTGVVDAGEVSSIGRKPAAVAATRKKKKQNQKTFREGFTPEVYLDLAESG